MLYKQTVESNTLELLIKLSKDKILKDFILVGGTALALQIGHRISVDLDLFTHTEFEESEILTHLENNYAYMLDYYSKNTLKGEIEGIKVDLISHQYPFVETSLLLEDIKMASLEDISAMKLNAITVNGTRIKDFIDVAYLSSELPFKRMMESYAKKYQNRNSTMVLKSLIHFDDIHFEEPIMMLNGHFDWDAIAYRLKEMVLNPDKVFDKLISK